MKSIGERILAQLSGRLPNALKEKMYKRFYSDRIQMLFPLDEYPERDAISFSDAYRSKSPAEMMDLAENFIKRKSESDWQHLKPYVKWIFARYANKGIRLWEDVAARAIPALLEYDKLKRKKKLDPAERDINRFKSLSDLEDLVEKYEKEDTRSGSERDKEIEQAFYDKGEAELIHDDSTAKIVKLKSERASCFFGRSTRWCTAAKTHNAFDSYTKDGDLYVIDPKGSKKKYQLQTQDGTGQEFLDEKDMSFDHALMYRQLSAKARRKILHLVLGNGATAPGLLEETIKAQILSEKEEVRLLHSRMEESELIFLYSNNRQRILDALEGSEAFYSDIYDPDRELDDEVDLDFNGLVFRNIQIDPNFIPLYKENWSNCAFMDCRFAHLHASGTWKNIKITKARVKGGVDLIDISGTFSFTQSSVLGSEDDPMHRRHMRLRCRKGTSISLDNSKMGTLMVNSTQTLKAFSARGIKCDVAFVRRGKFISSTSVEFGKGPGWEDPDFDLFTVDKITKVNPKLLSNKTRMARGDVLLVKKGLDMPPFAKSKRK